MCEPSTVINTRLDAAPLPLPQVEELPCERSFRLRCRATAHCSTAAHPPQLIPLQARGLLC